MPFKVAIIGLGRIGVTLEDDPLRIKPATHMGAYHSVSSVKVVAGCDIKEERRQYFQKRWNIPSVYSDYKQLLKNEKIDILSVATWTDSHYDIVVDAAKNPDVKVILCEKPIALNSQKAKKMIHICKKNKKLLVINHERRFEPRYRKVKEIIESEKIGKLRTIVGHVLTNVPLKQKSFSVDKTSLMHDGTHLIDMIHYLAGAPTAVSGHISKKQKEIITAVLFLKNDVTAFIEAGGLREYFDFELDIQGTKGRILIGNTFEKLFLKRKSKHYSNFYDLEEVTFPHYSKHPYFTEEIREIVRVLKGDQTKIASTGEDGLLALHVIETIFQSASKSS